MSVHKFNESYHKLRTMLTHWVSPLAHHDRRNKVLTASQIKEKPKIILMEINDMVQNLEVDLRVPFELHYLGHPFQEIADMLELSVDTVKSNVLQARMELKSTIENRYHPKIGA